MSENGPPPDESQRMWAIARRLRSLLPGDKELGDPLSLAGDKPSDVVARALAENAEVRPSATREFGLAAIQVWQALSESQGRGRGDEELAIVFTDLVGFSSWVLEAGDDAALELLREVGRAVEPVMTGGGGSIVKRLGDGLMAVFHNPPSAIDASYRACRAVDILEVAGHRPRLRVGVHVGRPRKLGGDYFGVDVNIAARVADAASGGEVLISDTVRDRLDPDAYDLKRLRRFRAKGAPRHLEVFAAAPR